MRFNSISRLVKKYAIDFLLTPIVAVLLYFWFLQIIHIESDQSKALQASSDAICSNIEMAFQDEMFALATMSRKWESDNGTDRKIWEKDALRVAKHFNFQAVEWVDGTVVEWIIPFEGNERAQNLDLSFEKNREDAILYSQGKKEESIGGPLDLVQGGIGLIVFAPIYENDKVVGFNVGVIRTKDHFSKIFDDYSGEYGIKISSGERELYSTPNQYEIFETRAVIVNNFKFLVEISYQPNMATNLKFLGMGSSLILICSVFILGVIISNRRKKVDNE
jgi:sensor domain CHASE-containing protein